MSHNLKALRSSLGLVLAVVIRASAQIDPTRLVGSRVFGDASGPLAGLSMPTPLQLFNSNYNLSAFRSSGAMSAEVEALLGIRPLSEVDITAANIAKEAIKLTSSIVGMVSKGVDLGSKGISLLTNGYKLAADPITVALQTQSFGFTLYDNQRAFNEVLYDEWSANIKRIPDLVQKEAVDGINEAFDNGILITQIGQQFDSLQRVRRLTEILVARYQSA